MNRISVILFLSLLSAGLRGESWTIVMDRELGDRNNFFLITPDIRGQTAVFHVPEPVDGIFLSIPKSEVIDYLIRFRESATDWRAMLAETWQSVLEDDMKRTNKEEIAILGIGIIQAVNYTLPRAEFLREIGRQLGTAEKATKTDREQVSVGNDR